MMMTLHNHAPKYGVIERMAREAMRRLPAAFQPYLSDIVIQVEEFADQETLSRMGIENPWQLVGLYRGHPVSRQSVWADGDLPPTILVYRQPLALRWQQSGASLEAFVNNLVVHEVGHHFGLSDEDMRALEGQAS